MSRCVAALRRCVLDWLIDLVRDVKHEEAWAALPQRIILIRHGQAEHNAAFSKGDHEAARALPLVVADYAFLRNEADQDLATVLVVKVLPFKIFFA